MTSAGLRSSFQAVSESSAKPRLNLMLSSRLIAGFALQSSFTYLLFVDSFSAERGSSLKGGPSKSATNAT